MLNDYDNKDSVFEKAMNMVEANLKNNPGEYGQQLGEIFALSKSLPEPQQGLLLLLHWIQPGWLFGRVQG